MDFCLVFNKITDLFRVEVFNDLTVCPLLLTKDKKFVFYKWLKLSAKTLSYQNKVTVK